MTTQDRLRIFLSKTPQIARSAYVAEQATIIGDVSLGDESSVWPGAVLRGDINSIKVGERTNIQDGTIIHLADDFGVIIGSDVTIGHGAIIHACTVEDECLIGMGATVMDGAVVGEQSIVGAGALVTQRMQIPAGSLVLGSPAKVVRALSIEERLGMKKMAAKYVIVAAAHKAKFSI